MILCRFDDDRLGLVEGSRVVDMTYTVDQLDPPTWPVRPGDPLVAGIDRVLGAIASGRADAPEHDLDAVRLQNVVTSPSKVMAAPANYAAHVAVDAQDPQVHHGVHHRQLQGLERPVESLGLFLKASSSVVGPADGIAVTDLARRTDHEVELAVVIGRQAKDVPAADAFEHVAGYCVGLDMSVRGTEDRSFRKSRDGFTVLGPWLTTRDEVPDPEDLTLWLDVNGTRRQQSSTGAMTVPIARMIELASAQYTLHPGDVLLTGTPEGVGPVVPGDVIVAGCDRLGEMTVEVRA